MAFYQAFLYSSLSAPMQASRAARIGMMLNGDSRGDQKYVPPTAPVEVGVVSLVVRQPMRGRTEGGDGASGEGKGVIVREVRVE